MSQPSTNDLGATARELMDMIKGYAVQETVAPLKAAGRIVGLGLAGAVMLGIGAITLALAILRLLQSETSVFDGNWSWVPYLIVMVVVGVAGAVTVAVMRRGGPKR